MEINRLPWRIWIRKHFPWLRPRSEFKNGETVEHYDSVYIVLDRRIDHCGQILLQEVETGQQLWVDPHKVYSLEESG